MGRPVSPARHRFLIAFALSVALVYMLMLQIRDGTLAADDPSNGSGAAVEDKLPPAPSAPPLRILMTPSSAQGTVSERIWMRRVVMPTSRYGLGVTTGDDGKIYAIGGNDPWMLRTVEAYDPATNAWTTRASLATPRRGLGVATANGKIYAIGGSRSNGTALNTVEEYDPATDSWVYRAKMLTARSAYYGGLGVASANGKVYAIGGNMDVAEVTVEEYDPVANTWRARASMPNARGGFAAATATNGKIYVFGGWSGSCGAAATVDEYDPVANAWASRTSMPTARVSPAAVAAPNGKIYVIGGSTSPCGGDYLNTVEEYDPAIDTWATVTSLSSPRGLLGAAAAPDGTIYAIGGKQQAYYDDGQNFVEAGFQVRSKVYLPDAAQSYDPPTTDTFSYSGSGWPVDDTDVYSRGYVDDEYRILVKREDTAVRAGRNLRAVDFQAEVDARAYGGTGGAYGLYFASDDSGFNAFQVINGSYMLRRYQATSNSWFVLLGPTQHAAIHSGNETNRLKIVLNGRNLTLYVNGQQVIQTGSYWFNQGFVGLIASGYEPNFEARFDNFALATIPTPKPTATPTYVPARTPTPLPTATPIPLPMTWVSRARLPVVNSMLAAVTGSNDKVYAMGGSGAGFLGSTYEYDPAIDTWTSKASMPTARSGLAAVAASNGKIYAMGGWTSTGVTNTVEAFDPLTNNWSTRASMPSSRATFGAAEIGGKIYAVGGLDDRVDIYDLGTDTWTTGTPMPTGRSGLGVVAVNGKIYAIGGQYGDTSSAVEEYDPGTDTWRARADMPHASYAMVAVAGSDGKIYVIPDNTVQAFYRLVDVFDPVANRWITRSATATFPIFQGITATSSGKIYSVGGYVNGPVPIVLEGTID